MTEKRFTKQESTIEKYMLYDNNKENAYFITCDEGTINAIVDLLNEQQATINKQKEEIINSHIAYVESLNEIKDLKEENEQLRQSYKYADELLEEIREVFEKNGVETGYNKRILETCFSALYENEQLRQENEKLKKCLQKTQEDLDFFATLKVTAMKGCEPMDETTNLEHQTWTGGKR